MACPHRLHTLAPDRLMPPQEGVEQVTRSVAMNKAQLSSSTTEPVWWCVMCLIGALKNPFDCICCTSMSHRWAQTQPERQVKTAQQPRTRVLKCHCSRLEPRGWAPKQALGRRRRGAALGKGRQAGKRERILDRRARRVDRKRQLGEGAGHPAGFLDRFHCPGGQVVGRRGNNGFGLRKARFQCGRIGLRIKLRHPAVPWATSGS